MRQVFFLLIAASILSLPMEGRASGEQIECESRTSKVKAVTSPGSHLTGFNFSGSGGNLDPVPLLRTEVLVGGHEPSCLVAHFSTMARPFDNHAVFSGSS